MSASGKDRTKSSSDLLQVPGGAGAKPDIKTLRLNQNSELQTYPGKEVPGITVA